MSVPHHGKEEEHAELLQRFMDELQGRADRRWPDGRISGEDDGQLTFAVAIDPNTNTLRIEFSKPTEWIAFDRQSAIAFRDKVDEFIEAQEAEK